MLDFLCLDSMLFVIEAQYELSERDGKALTCRRV